MRFAFKAFRRDGVLETGEIEASSRKDALRLLGDRGLVPFLAEPASASGAAGTATHGQRRSQRLSLAECAALTRELAVLLRAQLPIDTALRLVTSTSPTTPVGRFASLLHEALAAGTALSNAFAQAAPGAPPLIVSLLKAGEGRGNIAAAMEEIASYLEQRLGLSQRVKAALTYPLILAITAVIAVAIIVSVLVPALVPLFEGSGRELPPALGLAHALSNVVSDHWPVITFALVASLAGLTTVGVSPRFARVRQNALLTIPVVKDLKSQSEIAAYSRTLGALLRNGVPMVSALQNAREVLATDRFRTAMDGVTERVKEGQRLTDAVAASGVFPGTAISFISVGEESSRIDDMLLHLSSVAEHQYERRIDRLMTLLGPSMTVAIGVLVGGLVLSVMQAVLSINEVALK